jgi:thioredoxin 1
MSTTFREIIQSEKPVLVDFYATWCVPCKMMNPILSELKSTMGDKVTIIKIDVEKNNEAAHALEVQGVPTLMIFQNGQLKWRQSGVVGANVLKQVLNQYTH